MAEQDTLGLVNSYLDERVSFLVEAGAGSGKTSTLVRALHHLLETCRVDLQRSRKRIVCITYTNVAKDEIIARIAADSLVLVCTIHEFMWSVIEKFQIELRDALTTWNASSNSRPVADLSNLIANRKISYSDRGRRLEEGQISHDDVIKLSEALFKSHPKIARITTDRYPYLLVDEYQDTHPAMARLIVDAYAGQPEAVVGFFGDSMQKIYQSGIGRIESEKLKVVTKIENYRCSKKVITVLNGIRPSLQQIPAGNNRDGDVYFFAGPESIELTAVRAHLERSGWSRQQTKVLMLTHRGIASELSYSGLLAAYDKTSFGRDRLLGGGDTFMTPLRTLHQLVSAYERSDLAEVARLLRAEGFKFRRHSDKADQLQRVEELAEACRTKTVGNVLNKAFTLRLMVKSERMRRAEERAVLPDPSERDLKHREFLESLLQVPFHEVVNYFAFLDGSAPFFTQHGVKGTEYENVIVAIDDNAWNLYNMGRMMVGRDTSETRVERSRNLFYVCCSRAKSGLAVVFLNPPPNEAIAKAREWFGDDNVYSFV
jgi:DNA helicase-2/ATP-dependent DNA helicase PcrA